jgi:hypothetical protein
MPEKSKVTITLEQPQFLGEYDGVGQRKVDPIHVRELAENFALWKDKALLLWKDKRGTYVIGGQHRMKALREFVFPALDIDKLQMDALVYSAADVPAGMETRDLLLMLIQADNAGKENSTFDVAQLDHRKPWYSVTKAHGIEFGSGGTAKALQTEGIIRATAIARGYLETGVIKPYKWLDTYNDDMNTDEIERIVLYSRWWDENVTMPAAKISARISMNKPVCLSLFLAIVLDPKNGMPSSPADLHVTKAKHRTLLEAPTKLLACALYDRTKGNNYPTIWTQVLEPINSAKKAGTGRLLVGGFEKWI